MLECEDGQCHFRPYPILYLLKRVSRYYRRLDLAWDQGERCCCLNEQENLGVVYYCHSLKRLMHQ